MLRPKAPRLRSSIHPLPAPHTKTRKDGDDVELNVLGCRVDILGTNCDQCVCMVQCCFTSTETIRLIMDGHLDFHTAPDPKRSDPLKHDCHHRNQKIIRWRRPCSAKQHSQKDSVQRSLISSSALLYVHRDHKNY